MLQRKWIFIATLSALVAAYGQQLRGGKYNGNMTWDGIYKLAHGAAAHDPFGERAEFLHLLKKRKI